MGNSAVKEIPYNSANNTYGAAITIGSGFYYPTGIAIDAGGNLFVADNSHNAVKEIPYDSANNAYGAPTTISSGFGDLYGGRNRNHYRNAGNLSGFVETNFADTPKTAPADGWLLPDTVGRYRT